MSLDSDSKEHLKEWLVKSLESISDAEPQVLSTYVLALVHNDPLDSGLKEICTSKLEEFLGDETSEFVDRLLTALKEESYLPRNKRKQNPILNYPRHEHHTKNTGNHSEVSSYPGNNNGNMTKRRRGGSDEYRQGGRRRDDHHRHHPYHQYPAYPPQQQYPPRRGDQHHRSENKSRDDYQRYPGPYGGPPLDPYGRPIPPHMMMMMNAPPHHFPHPRNPDHGGYYGGHHGGGRPQDQQQKQNYGEERFEIEQGEETDENDRTTLLIDHVDPEYFNVSKIAIHFSRFGNVVNIQMLPAVNNALVQFSTYAEALSAFKSPIPVCNNRFIRVQWSKTLPENPKDGLTEEEIQKKTDEVKAAALAQGKEVLEQKRKLMEQQKELKKKKEVLVKQQLEQHQLLLEKIANKAGVEAEKEILRVKITSLTQQLAQLQGVIPASAVKAKDEPETKQPLGTTPFNTRGRGGRMSRGRGSRGRGGRGRGGHALDNRTTILKVGNVPDQAQEKSVLEQHYVSFGKIKQLLFDPQDRKVAYVEFQDRYTAQRAMQHGTFFGETPLTVQWIESEELPTSSSKGEAASATATSVTREV